MMQQEEQTISDELPINIMKYGLISANHKPC